MNKKTVYLPVPKHLAHFAMWEFQCTDTLAFGANFYANYDRSHTRYKDVANFFHRPGYVLLKVELYNPNLRQQYYMIRYLEEQFKMRMHEYIAHATARCIRDAIREFLFVKLDLGEDDYNVESAYKSWQRARSKISTKKEVFTLKRFPPASSALPILGA